MANGTAQMDTGHLLSLAENRSKASRSELFDNISELFIAEEHRLTDRERSLFVGILENILADVEFAVRVNLAKRLSERDAAPAELLELVANDDIEVARPLLRHSSLLRDEQLIAIVRQRGREHAVAIAERAHISAEVSDALVATRDTDVVTRLLENASAELSRWAMDYVVAEAERVDRFREPLVRRADLPTDLAMRLYWYVSAAWRRHILQTFPVRRGIIDDVLQQAARDAAEDAGTPTGRAAGEFARVLHSEKRLTPGLILDLLRQRRVVAAAAAIGHLTNMEERIVRHALMDSGGESLAVFARAAGFDRDAFGHLLSMSVHFARGSARDGALNEVVALYDRISEEQAHEILAYWRRDRGYVNAIANLEQEIADASGGAPFAAPFMT